MAEYSEYTVRPTSDCALFFCLVFDENPQSTTNRGRLRPSTRYPTRPPSESCRWSEIVPPDAALTFAVIWNPDDDMVAFSRGEILAQLEEGEGEEEDNPCSDSYNYYAQAFPQSMAPSTRSSICEPTSDSTTTDTDDHSFFESASPRRYPSVIPLRDPGHVHSPTPMCMTRAWSLPLASVSSPDTNWPTGTSTTTATAKFDPPLIQQPNSPTENRNSVSRLLLRNHTNTPLLPKLTFFLTGRFMDIRTFVTPTIPHQPSLSTRMAKPSPRFPPINKVLWPTLEKEKTVRSQHTSTTFITLKPFEIFYFHINTQRSAAEKESQEYAQLWPAQAIEIDGRQRRRPGGQPGGMDMDPSNPSIVASRSSRSLHCTTIWTILVYLLARISLSPTNSTVVHLISIGYGVMVNIIASHAIARGSIPRIRTFSFSRSKGPPTNIPLRYSTKDERATGYLTGSSATAYKCHMSIVSEPPRQET